MTAHPADKSNLVLPTLGQVMLRPKWLIILFFIVILAVFFAFLGKWQLDSAVYVGDAPSKTKLAKPVALDILAKPARVITENQAGERVSAVGKWRVDDFEIVASRPQGARTGWWLLGDLELRSGAHVAVALGWVSNEFQAKKWRDDVVGDLILNGGQDAQLVGSYQPAEAAKPPRSKDSPYMLNAVAPAQLFNIWNVPAGQMYHGFIVLDSLVKPADDVQSGAGNPQSNDSQRESSQSSASGQQISNDNPAWFYKNFSGAEKIALVYGETGTTINWLNIFYAAEWAVFAVFALFFWYRMVKDAWEKEIEDILG